MDDAFFKLQKGVEAYKIVHLTHAQCDALAEIAEHLGPNQVVAMQQTYSKSGGTHLYAQTSEELKFHIAKDGKMQAIDFPGSVFDDFGDVA